LDLTLIDVLQPGWNRKIVHPTDFSQNLLQARRSRPAQIADARPSAQQTVFVTALDLRLDLTTEGQVGISSLHKISDLSLKLGPGGVTSHRLLGVDRQTPLGS
jgi:hypothetical protein